MAEVNAKSAEIAKLETPAQLAAGWLRHVAHASRRAGSRGFPAPNSAGTQDAG